MMTPDVVGCGALNYDVLYQVDRLSEPGGHEPIRSVHKCPGGSAANTVSGIARLGFSAGFLGAVGDDAEGREILSLWEREGVDVGHIQVVGAATGLIIGFVDRHGERTLYPYPSANNEFRLTSDAIAYASQAKLVHLTSFVGDRQFCDQQKLIDGLPAGVKVSFGPGDLYAERGYGGIKSMLKRTDYLFVNRPEVELITGQSYDEGARFLANLGIGVVAVTLGERGCFVVAAGEEQLVPSDPIHRAEVVDTTGAGDSFAAGFLAGQLWGRSVEESARIGNRYAASCITCLGARSGLCGKEDLLE